VSARDPGHVVLLSAQEHPEPRNPQCTRLDGDKLQRHHNVLPPPKKYTELTHHPPNTYPKQFRPSRSRDKRINVPGFRNLTRPPARHNHYQTGSGNPNACLRIDVYHVCDDHFRFFSTYPGRRHRDTAMGLQPWDRLQRIDRISQGPNLIIASQKGQGTLHVCLSVCLFIRPLFHSLPSVVSKDMSGHYAGTRVHSSNG